MVKISKNLCFVEENCYVARLYMYIKYSKIHSYLKEKICHWSLFFHCSPRFLPFCWKTFILFIYLNIYTVSLLGSQPNLDFKHRENVNEVFSP